MEGRCLEDKSNPIYANSPYLLGMSVAGFLTGGQWLKVKSLKSCLCNVQETMNKRKKCQ